MNCAASACMPRRAVLQINAGKLERLCPYITCISIDYWPAQR
jgi:hypothetical protein